MTNTNYHITLNRQYFRQCFQPTTYFVVFYDLGFYVAKFRTLYPSWKCTLIDVMLGLYTCKLLKTIHFQMKNIFFCSFFLKVLY